ncbi:hypothetical protein [Paenibacillus sp. NPDC058071]|uniref:hypothetical protein n=1 Tax=Paenibacillus sp. NPDC058071 TaxID=3346326 RepID=UPI0036D8CED4
MKKLAVLLLAASIVLSGCSGAKKENTPASTNEVSNNKQDKGIEVDKKLLNVDVTLPAAMFEGQDMEQIIEDAKADGVKEVVKNDDGSLTYTMSKSTHEAMLKEMAAGIKESIEEILTDGTFASIKDIQYKDDFSEYTISVDKAAYQQSMDGFVIIGLSIQAITYKTFEGISADKQKVTMNVKDESTGEVFHTQVFPQTEDKQ